MRISSLCGKGDPCQRIYIKWLNKMKNNKPCQVLNKMSDNMFTLKLHFNYLSCTSYLCLANGKDI